MPTQNEIRERVSKQLIDALSKGDLPPWRMPWRSDPNAGFPTNVASKRHYRGINPLLLQLASMRHGFQSKWWATFRQWDEMGGSVMKRPDDVKAGEWGTSIIFFKPLQIVEKDDNGKEREKTIFVMRTYVVFNLDQVRGSHLNHLRVGHNTTVSPDPIVTYEEADRVIAATGADIRYGGNRAYYNRHEDHIRVPLREQFTAGEYYETILHELAHWTEHPNRLDFHAADHKYALGELRAEICACYLAGELGIPNADSLQNHASYVASWLREMKSDPKYIFQAAAMASKASDFILSFSRTEVPEPEEALAE